MTAALPVTRVVTLIEVAADPPPTDHPRYGIGDAVFFRPHPTGRYREGRVTAVQTGLVQHPVAGLPYCFEPRCRTAYEVRHADGELYGTAAGWFAEEELCGGWPDGDVATYGVPAEARRSGDEIAAELDGVSVPLPAAAVVGPADAYAA